MLDTKDNDKGNIIVLEWLIGAGKTTLYESLSTTEYHKIKEYKEYSWWPNNFPKFPYKSKREALESIDYFLNIETQRWNDIFSMQNWKDIILDRSPLSCMAFSYASRILAENKFSIYKETIQRFEDLYEKNKFRLPTKVLYLKIPYEVSIARSKIREDYSEDHFADRDFNLKLTEFYDHFSEKSEHFKAIDGTMDKELVLSESIKTILQWTKGEIIDIFNIANMLD